MAYDALNGLYIVGLAAIWLIRIPHLKGSRQKRIIDDRASVVDSALLVFALAGNHIIPALYLLTPWLDFADYRLPKILGLFGAIVFSLSLWLFWKAHADLGHNWSITLQIGEEHSLVTAGVYGYVRHPMYTAFWLWGLAQTILLQNWIAGFAMLGAMALLCTYRLPREEKMLLEQFGEAYHSYSNSTGRFIPRLLRNDRH